MKTIMATIEATLKVLIGLFIYAIAAMYVVIFAYGIGDGGTSILAGFGIFVTIIAAMPWYLSEED